MRDITIVVVCVAVVLSFGCKRGEDHFIQEKVDLTGIGPEQAYVALNCARCHGADLEGQRTAPKLTGLAERWDQERLIAYLRNPNAVQAATPRLAYLSEKYPIEMPAYSHTDEQVLLGLVSWLLAQ
jgi:cytochrome c553